MVRKLIHGFRRFVMPREGKKLIAQGSFIDCSALVKSAQDRHDQSTAQIRSNSITTLAPPERRSNQEPMLRP
jgi:hypothetical protein